MVKCPKCGGKIIFTDCEWAITEEPPIPMTGLCPECNTWFDIELTITTIKESED